MLLRQAATFNDVVMHRDILVSVRDGPLFRIHTDDDILFDESGEVLVELLGNPGPASGEFDFGTALIISGDDARRAVAIGRGMTTKPQTSVKLDGGRIVYFPAELRANAGTTPFYVGRDL